MRFVRVGEQNPKYVYVGECECACACAPKNKKNMMDVRKPPSLTSNSMKEFRDRTDRRDSLFPKPERDAHMTVEDG